MENEMKKFIIYIGFLLIINFTTAQNQWAVAFNMPQGNTLIDIYAIDEYNVVAVGSDGEILTTNDGGTLWMNQQSGTDYNLSACSAVQSEIWVVGENGTILYSHDFGISWLEQISNTTNNLRSVSFVDNLNGWVVGADGIILHTSDGGNSWTVQNSNTFAFLNKVQFINNLSGWCVGHGGLIMHTNDGGLNWDKQESNTTKNLIDISLPNENVGYISFDGNDSGSVLKTINGGQTWELIIVPFSYFITSIHFIDENTGWVNREDYVSYTNDGGDTWTQSGIGGKVYALYFIDENIGWSVGGKDGTIIAKTDNAIDWKYQIDETVVPLNSIVFADDNKGWAVGGNYYNYNGASPDIIYHTENGGLNWYEQLDISGKGIYDIQSLNDSLCYAISGSGVYKTFDGGLNWKYTEINYNVLLSSISFVNDTTGFIAGSYNQIFKTINGGESWEYINTNFGTIYFQSIYFIDENKGWASGYSTTPLYSKIIHTTDSGETWEMQYEEPGGRTWIHFENSLEGWAVSVDGVILHTENGGVSWETQVSNLSVKLTDVFFLDEETGWTVGEEGKIISTVDGGNNWIIQESNTSRSLYSIYAKDINDVWVTGSNGIILHYKETSLINKDDFLLSFELHQNYPNPFNPITNITYELPQNGKIELIIYDITGRQLETLVNTFQTAGYHTISWNASSYPSGVYLIRMASGDFTQTQKVVLVK